MIQKTNPIHRWKQWLALPLLGVLLVAVACEKAAPPAATSAPADARLAPPPPSPPSQSFASNSEKAVDVAEVMPEYPGGMEKLMHDVGVNLSHAVVLSNGQAGGKWFVRFTVGSDGTVRGVQIQLNPQVAKTLAPSKKEHGEEAVWVAMQVLQQNMGSYAGASAEVEAGLAKRQARGG